MRRGKMLQRKFCSFPGYNFGTKKEQAPICVFAKMKIRLRDEEFEFCLKALHVKG